MFHRSAREKGDDALGLKCMNSYKEYFTKDETSKLLKFYTSEPRMKLLDKNKSIEEHSVLLHSDKAKRLS